MDLKSNLILVFAQGIISIISVIIAAKLSAKKVVEDLNPQFFTYSDQNVSLHPMLQSAIHDIYIIVALGNNFLSKYSRDLLVAAANGVKIHYLYLSDQELLRSDEYMYGQISDDLDEKKEFVTQKLDSLQQKIPLLNDTTVHGSLEVRRFQEHLSASYIGVDLDIEKNLSMDSSIIQTMLYQYHVESKKSITSKITPRDNETIFHITSNSIRNIWNSAK